MNAPILISGSAFNQNKFKGYRIQSHLYREQTYFVSLTEWCKKNYISKRQGRRLLARGLLVGQRLRGQWWVCANICCLEELLEELDIDVLYFDADNKLPCSLKPLKLMVDP